MPYRIIDHTADAAVEATASSLPALIGELARAIGELMAGDQVGKPTDSIGDFSVVAETPQDAVVDVLSELLWRSEAARVLPVAVSVVEEPSGSFQVTARGIPYDRAPLTGAPIKAVTYHDLEVQPRGDAWIARVVFDV